MLRVHDFPAQPPPWTCMDCALHHHAECRVMQESVYSFFWCRCLLVSHHVKVRRFPPSFNTSTQPRCDFFVHDCWEIMQKPPPLFLMFEQKVWGHQTIPLNIVYAKLTCSYKDELHILLDLLATSSRNGHFISSLENFGHFISSLWNIWNK